MNGEQKQEREAQRKAIKVAYDGVLKRIDNLLDLKLSPDNIDDSLISNDEFLEKKRELLAEKKKVADAFAKLDKDVEEWTEFCADAFDLAKRAVEKFNNGSFEDKKMLLQTIGSNLTLKDKQLDISMRTPFLVAKQIKEEIEKNNPLEPREKTDNTSYSNEFILENTSWGE